MVSPATAVEWHQLSRAQALTQLGVGARLMTLWQGIATQGHSIAMW